MSFFVQAVQDCSNYLYINGGAFVLKTTSLVRQFEELLHKSGDSRVRDWLFMSNPLPIFGLIAFYIYFVKDLGPKLMRHRKPFKLKNTLLFYNLFQVVISAYVFFEMGMSGWFGKYNYRCQPVDYSSSPGAIRMLHVSAIATITKFIDLMDTVFFVLRKKNEQISILHVTHHSLMPISLWFGLKFVPGGHGTFLVFINSLVHIIMYGYYFLSALGPEIQRYLWWKKYLTAIQLMQMVFIILHSFQLIFRDCNYPKVFALTIGLEAVLFGFMFCNFYQKSYNKRKTT